MGTVQRVAFYLDGRAHTGTVTRDAGRALEVRVDGQGPRRLVLHREQVEDTWTQCERLGAAYMQGTMAGVTLADVYDELEIAVHQAREATGTELVALARTIAQSAAELSALVEPPQEPTRGTLVARSKGCPECGADMVPWAQVGTWCCQGCGYVAMPH